MRHRFETWFAGLLVLCMCFFAACVTETDRTDPGTPPATAQVTSESAASEPATAAPGEQVSQTAAADDDDFIAPDAVTGLLPASVTSCIRQCDGDQGCIDCCRCAHPTQCCM